MYTVASGIERIRAERAARREKIIRSQQERYLNSPGGKRLVSEARNGQTGAVTYTNQSGVSTTVGSGAVVGTITQTGTNELTLQSRQSLTTPSNKQPSETARLLARETTRLTSASFSNAQAPVAAPTQKTPLLGLPETRRISTTPAPQQEKKVSLAHDNAVVQPLPKNDPGRFQVRAAKDILTAKRYENEGTVSGAFKGAGYRARALGENLITPLYTGAQLINSLQPRGDARLTGTQAAEASSTTSSAFKGFMDSLGDTSQVRGEGINAELEGSKVLASNIDLLVVSRGLSSLSALKSAIFTEKTVGVFGDIEISRLPPVIADQEFAKGFAVSSAEGVTTTKSVQAFSITNIKNDAAGVFGGRKSAYGITRVTTEVNPFSATAGTSEATPRVGANIELTLYGKRGAVLNRALISGEGVSEGGAESATTYLKLDTIKPLKGSGGQQFAGVSESTSNLLSSDKGFRRYQFDTTVLGTQGISREAGVAREAGLGVGDLNGQYFARTGTIKSVRYESNSIRYFPNQNALDVYNAPKSPLVNVINKIKSSKPLSGTSTRVADYIAGDVTSTSVDTVSTQNIMSMVRPPSFAGRGASQQIISASTEAPRAASAGMTGLKQLTTASLADLRPGLRTASTQTAEKAIIYSYTPKTIVPRLVIGETVKNDNYIMGQPTIQRISEPLTTKSRSRLGTLTGTGQNTTGTTETVLNTGGGFATSDFSPRGVAALPGLPALPRINLGGFGAATETALRRKTKRGYRGAPTLLGLEFNFGTKATGRELFTGLEFRR